MRRLQFSLRSLLIVVSAVALLTARQSMLASRQREAVRAIHEIGGVVWYDDETPDLDLSYRLIASYPHGSLDDFFHSVIGVRLAGPRVHDEQLDVLRQLPRLTHVVLQDTMVTDAAIDRLKMDLPKCNVERFDTFDVMPARIQPAQ
jgi:hypothetical protein